MKKYFIDTSIWIDYFNDTDKKLNDKIDDLIDDNFVFINGIVITELLHGSNNDKDYDNLKNYFNGLNFLDINRDLFDKISFNGYKLKKSGIRIPLSDLIIATQCVENNLILIDKDKHYKIIQNVLGLLRMF